MADPRASKGRETRAPAPDAGGADERQPPWGGRSLLGPPRRSPPPSAARHRWLRLALRLGGLLLIASALLLALSRAPDRSVQSLVARWAPPPSDFIELGPQLVHLRDVGPRDDPLPIVLVHGAFSSLHTWEGWVPALAAQRRVISFDLPGFGLSGPPAVAQPQYGGDHDARFVLALLRRLGVQRFAIGGHSLGGEVAWRVASLVPDRVAALLLVDPLCGPCMPPGLPWYLEALRHQPLRSLATTLLPRDLIAAARRHAYADGSPVAPDVVDRHFELLLREGNREALLDRLDQWRTAQQDARPIAARLARISAPTLLLWGAQDRLLPLADARGFIGRLPQARLQVFDKLGHVPQEEDAAATLALVKPFFGLR